MIQPALLTNDEELLAVFLCLAFAWGIQRYCWLFAAPPESFANTLHVPLCVTEVPFVPRELHSDDKLIKKQKRRKKRQYPILLTSFPSGTTQSVIEITVPFLFEFSI